MTSYDVDDTIVAIASAPGAGFRGIVRISGPETLSLLDPCFLVAGSAENKVSLQQCRRTSVFDVRCALPGECRPDSEMHIPGRLMVWPATSSYTRQPTAEFHTLAPYPLLEKILNKACRQGARLAKPGEFTLRAFLSGRIDLTQAEAVLAVIDSEGDQQLNRALNQLSGGLATPLSEMRNSLLSLLAELEAGLDFVEEDIEFISTTELDQQLQHVKNSITQILARIRSRSQTSGKIRIVLSGLPNSGKSSLFNALSKQSNSDNRPGAIVTDLPGTTTDFMSAQLNIGDTQVQLIDTAGYEPILDRLDDGAIISNAAQSHRNHQQQSADIQVLCTDLSRGLNDWEQQFINSDNKRPHLIVLNKIDVAAEPAEIRESKIRELGFTSPVVTTSCQSNTGIDQLADTLQELCADLNVDSQVVGTTVVRAFQSLVETESSLVNAIDTNQLGLGEELVAAEVRQALEELGTVMGTVYTDDILDLVFSRFCIGK